MGQMLAGRSLFTFLSLKLRICVKVSLRGQSIASGTSLRDTPENCNYMRETGQWHNKKAALAHRLFYLDPG